MLKKLSITIFILFIVNNINAYVIDFDDFRHFLSNSNHRLENICSRKVLLSTDIKVVGKNYLIQSDVPGIDKSNIKVTFKDGSLKIAVNVPKSSPSDNYILQERLLYQSEISRRFKLQDADLNGNITVKLKDGVLHIEVPKSKNKSAREIEIM